MAWFHIKYTKRKSKVSSSNNCNKFFGLHKIQNFRAPNKSDSTAKTRTFLSRIQKRKINKVRLKKIVGQCFAKNRCYCKDNASFEQKLPY